MDELDFYNNLKLILTDYKIRTNTDIATTLDKVNKRLDDLEQKEKINNWDKLCLLIESTAKQYERTNNKYTDITVDYDYAEITITNRLYNYEEF